jgi:SAM-dependent methyltransferase
MTIKLTDNGNQEIKKAVRTFYADAITVNSGSANCECGSGCCTESSSDKKVKGLIYADPNFMNLPDAVTEISFGCGDPVTLASLVEGQTVLDLGSGGGVDCFLAGKRVGETGYVIGVDMTPEMIDRARNNLEKVGAQNVEFRLGEIEHLPVADGSVDVVISNCVINLSTDKPQVFKEIYRVLKPGGRLAISDIVTDGELPEELKKSLTDWAGCIAGAWDVKDYTAAIRNAGFNNVAAKPIYFDKGLMLEAVKVSDADARDSWDEEMLQKSVFSAKVTAVKPLS